MGETNLAQPRRINLGCGFDHRAGYLNVDFQEFHNPDMTADVKDLSALADESFDEALALGVLEHLERGDVVPTLREWLRVLAPGGSLHLQTPDVVGIGASIARRDEVVFHHLMVQGVYGTQAYQGEYHHAGFTDLTLIDQLFEAGYDEIRIGRLHGWMLKADARRPADSAVNPIAIGLGHSVSPPEADGETQWRWCERASEILLFARSADPIDVHLELKLFRPEDRTEIELIGAGLRHQAIVSGAATISCELTLAPGPTRLSMVSHGPAVPTPADPRHLHVQLLGISAVPAQWRPGIAGSAVREPVVAHEPRADSVRLRASSLALRGIWQRIAQEPPQDEAVASPLRAEGFQLTLDYPPSAERGPRWGYGRAAHDELRALIAAHDATYRVQLDLIAGFADELSRIDRSAPHADEPSWINGFLPGLDGAALYAFVRARAPRRYLEVGSGTSTKFVARAKRDAALSTAMVSIDPQPRSEVDALCDHVYRQPLETCSLDVFRELETGDVLFFDGSHRAFTNSDATVFFLEVLPSLAAGTLVGIHDIYLPDDYPPQWNDRYYSEQYLLAAYLMAGCRWLEPTLAAWYVSSHPELGRRLQSLWEHPRMKGVERHGGAFWFTVKERAPDS